MFGRNGVGGKIMADEKKKAQFEHGPDCDCEDEPDFITLEFDDGKEISDM